jgi:hypothetical protein
VSISLAPERCPTPARPITPMVNDSSTNRSYQRSPLGLKNEPKQYWNIAPAARRRRAQLAKRDELLELVGKQPADLIYFPFAVRPQADPSTSFCCYALANLRFDVHVVAGADCRPVCF